VEKGKMAQKRMNKLSNTAFAKEIERLLEEKDDKPIPQATDPKAVFARMFAQNKGKQIKKTSVKREETKEVPKVQARKKGQTMMLAIDNRCVPLFYARSLDKAKKAKGAIVKKDPVKGREDANDGKFSRIARQYSSLFK
jgi:hypothetical protein